jgi:hypothetical protein
VKGAAFVDTTILLGGLIDLGPSARPAQALFAALAAGRLGRPATAWHCCLEFYSVATRLPEEFRLTPADAVTLLEREVLPRFRTLDLPSGARRRLLHDCVRTGIRGGRLYDAHIAEVARASGARLVITENVRHFSVLESRGVAVMSAAEALKALRR